MSATQAADTVIVAKRNVQVEGPLVGRAGIAKLREACRGALTTALARLRRWRPLPARPHDTMKILALETTERIGSVALLDDPNLLYEKKLDPNKRSAQSLAPAIAEALERAGWRATDVDLVATTIGPGSFTGLRVGVTTAKTFAYCARAEVLGIDTLEAIAAAVPALVAAVSVAMDAQRGQVVTALFERDEDGWMRPRRAAELVDVEVWLANLPDGMAVAGPILAKIADRVPERVAPLAPQYWHPTAGVVARLAARRYAEGQRDDLWKLVPRYSRRSAAEEKWAKRER